MRLSKITKLALIAILLTPLASFASKDVVEDQSGNNVINSFGNCVRTKWDTNTEKCGRANAPVSLNKERKRGNVSRSYITFFDFDGTTLTGNAKDIIAASYNNAGSGGVFHVTGHADRAGNANYNQTLSARRAAAVKKALVNLGAKSSNIRTHAQGESTPLVSTKDGAREPQNRRVEIVYEK